MPKLHRVHRLARRGVGGAEYRPGNPKTPRRGEVSQVTKAG